MRRESLRHIQPIRDRLLQTTPTCETRTETLATLAATSRTLSTTLNSIATHSVPTAALATSPSLIAALATALTASTLAMFEKRPGRERVVHSKTKPAPLLLLLTQRPWLMHLEIRQLLQLWAPMPDVRALIVIILRLLHDVEAVDTPAGEPRRGNPIPPVRARVGIEEERLEMISAGSPVQLQI